jgi:hypothetical protein
MSAHFDIDPQLALMRLAKITLTLPSSASCGSSASLSDILSVQCGRGWMSDTDVLGGEAEDKCECLRCMSESGNEEVSETRWRPLEVCLCLTRGKFHLSGAPLPRRDSSRGIVGCGSSIAVYITDYMLSLLHYRYADWSICCCRNARGKDANIGHNRIMQCHVGGSNVPVVSNTCDIVITLTSYRVASH